MVSNAKIPRNWHKNASFDQFCEIEIFGYGPKTGQKWAKMGILPQGAQHWILKNLGVTQRHRYLKMVFSDQKLPKGQP